MINNKNWILSNIQLDDTYMADLATDGEQHELKMIMYELLLKKIRTVFLDYWKENNERLRSGAIAYHAITPFPSLSLSLSLSFSLSLSLSLSFNKIFNFLILSFYFFLIFFLFNGWDWKLLFLTFNLNHSLLLHKVQY